jgi:hypothetical protein
MGSALYVGTTALKKKGLRQGGESILYTILVGTTALKKKGLRPMLSAFPRGRPCWNYCPEEEGIKTVA